MGRHCSEHKGTGLVRRVDVEISFAPVEFCKLSEPRVENLEEKSGLKIKMCDLYRNSRGK